MDLRDSAAEAAFRTEVREWLGSNAPAVDVSERARTANIFEEIARARVWQRRLYDAGYAGITWPQDYGGRGGSAIEAVIFAEEEARYLPWEIYKMPFTAAHSMAGPLIMHFGTDRQKDDHLRALLRGDEIWCQLFSEPDAGSDLASLTTRAEPDGDHFVVTGQKVWTSKAHAADFGLLLARTNHDVPKHKGITYFLLDMRTPGVDVRPLRQLTGEAHFNEVFLNDVRVPAANVVGGVDQGWSVVHATLSQERAMIGAIAGSMAKFPELLRLARQRDTTAQPVVRQALAACYTREALLRFMRLRIQTALSQERVLGAEASLTKLAQSIHSDRSAQAAMAIDGMAGVLDAEEYRRFSSVEFVNYLAYKLGGGTEEIQRNALAERILGLPR